MALSGGSSWETTLRLSSGRRGQEKCPALSTEPGHLGKGPSLRRRWVRVSGCAVKGTGVGACLVVVFIRRLLKAGRLYFYKRKD